jgi:hypothetical protein
MPDPRFERGHNVVKRLGRDHGDPLHIDVARRHLSCAFLSRRSGERYDCRKKNHAGGCKGSECP